MKQHRVAEIMDSPDISPASHHRALAGLERINTWSDSAGIVWREIRPLVQPGRTLRILDVATGAGDVPIGLWHRAAEERVAVEIAACDKSATAVEHARRNAQKHSASVHFFQCDIFSDVLPAGYDIVISSLFMHHLDAAQAVTFLTKLSKGAGQRLIINDLRRSAAGWVLALTAACVLRSRVVLVDGPRSVRAAYTMDEAAKLAAEAGLPGVHIQPRFPFRFVMTWSRL
jgi:2-polyprenyl-3-methyl-5-hydroxy-6-metoxy-1,4-benzoquinol methylase